MSILSTMEIKAWNNLYKAEFLKSYVRYRSSFLRLQDLIVKAVQKNITRKWLQFTVEMADFSEAAIEDCENQGWSMHLIVYMAAYDLVSTNKIPDLAIQAVDRDGSVYLDW